MPCSSLTMPDLTNFLDPEVTLFFNWISHTSEKHIEEHTKYHLFINVLCENSAVDTDDTIAYDVNFFNVTSHF